MAGRKPSPPAPLADGVISGLVAKRGGSGRVAVYLEGKAAFDVAAVLAERAALRVGDLLVVEDQERLMEEDAPYQAREKALRLLGVRERSRREVELCLQRAGFPGSVVSDALTWLEGLSYVDDRRFVERYAGEKLKHGWGERRVRAELLRKGVDRRIIDEGLSATECVTGAAGGDLGAVTALARRRFGKQFAVDPEAAARRLAGFLARRGYDWDAVHTVARVLTTEAADDDGGSEGDDGAGRGGVAS